MAKGDPGGMAQTGGNTYGGFFHPSGSGMMGGSSGGMNPSSSMAPTGMNRYGPAMPGVRDNPITAPSSSGGPYNPGIQPGQSQLDFTNQRRAQSGMSQMNQDQLNQSYQPGGDYYNSGFNAPKNMNIGGIGSMIGNAAPNMLRSDVMPPTPNSAIGPSVGSSPFGNGQVTQGFAGPQSGGSMGIANNEPAQPVDKSQSPMAPNIVALLAQLFGGQQKLL